MALPKFVVVCYDRFTWETGNDFEKVKQQAEMIVNTRSLPNGLASLSPRTLLIKNQQGEILETINQTV